MVVLDSVRKDVFDDHAPRLHELAAAAAPACRAASSWTVPSHASMLTGELPHRHGVHSHDRDFSRVAGDTVLDELPHRAVGVSANTYLGGAFGADALFDEFHEVSQYRRFADGDDVYAIIRESDATGLGLYRDAVAAALRSDHPLLTLANGAALKLRGALAGAPVATPFDDGTAAACDVAATAAASADEPFAMVVNLMEAHPPFQRVRGYDDVGALADVPAGWTSREFDLWAVNERGERDANAANLERFRACYRAAVDYLDRHVTDLVERLRAATDRETTVVVTADHGENLGYEGDDGLVGHVGSLSEGLLHVPLLVIDPPEGAALDGFDGGYLSQLALPELLRGLATGDLDADDLVGGTAAAELVGGISEDADVPLDDDRRRHWNRMQRAVYDGDEKVVWDSEGTVSWYGVGDGACRQRRLDRDDPVPEEARARFETPIREYKEHASRDDRPAEIDAATARDLERLGYL